MINNYTVSLLLIQCYVHCSMHMHTATALQFSCHEHMLSINCGTCCAVSYNSSAGGIGVFYPIQSGPGYLWHMLPCGIMQSWCRIAAATLCIMIWHVVHCSVSLVCVIFIPWHIMNKSYDLIKLCFIGENLSTSEMFATVQKFVAISLGARSHWDDFTDSHVKETCKHCVWYELIV